MLVLTRRTDEEIVFPTTATRVRVLAARAGAVSLGIDAPPDIPVRRGELPDREAEWGPASPEPGSRLAAVAKGVGLAELQMEAGMVDEARATLAAVRQGLLRLQGYGRRYASPREMLATV
jgi:carbon storage regulator CsrA